MDIRLARYTRSIKFHPQRMRITIEVDATELKQLQRITGQKKKSPAIAQALKAFIRQRQKQQFISRVLSGGTDYPLTNDQLEGQDVYEAH